MKRHTHATTAGLEDAIAVVTDMQFEIQMTLEYINARAAQLAEILEQIRSGPDKYDPDRPAGPKPVRAVRRIKLCRNQTLNKHSNSK